MPQAALDSEKPLKLTTIVPGAIKHDISDRGIKRLLEEVQTVFSVAWISLRASTFGTYLGGLWIIVDPLLQATTYWILLTFILAVAGSDVQFSLFFSALTLWRSHAVITTGAAGLINTFGMRYAIAGLPIRMAYMEFVATEFFMLLIRLPIVLIFLTITGNPPQITWLFVIPIVIVQFTFSTALCVWLSLAGNTVRDVGNIVGHFVWLWWFFSPGLYNISRIPEWFRPIYETNPFAHIFPALHGALLKGQIVHGPQLLIIFIGSLFLLWLGSLVVKRNQHSLYFRV